MQYLNDLNDAQRKAVTHIDGPMLVLAGAGSGKTRVITRRIAHLVDNGIPPWEILAITFTNKAAGELRDRIGSLGIANGVTACTFHSLCARLLRQYAEEIGIDNNYSIYDTQDQTRLIKKILKSFAGSSSNTTPSSTLAAISRAKMNLLGPQDMDSDASPHNRYIAKIYQGYQDALKQANALDFDDLLMKMAFLLRDKPNIRQQLSERYKYILIDEYQDTNHAQYIIAHGIAMAHKNICATGDPDQSIYSWRGADISNILEFESDYPNALVVRLEENYRSINPILRTACRLISYNTDRKHKELYSNIEGDEKVSILTAADEHAESTEIARQIKAIVSEGKADYDDIAIFYRLNSLSRVMEDALRRSFIPYRIARGVEFYNRKEIRDVLAYLKLLANPSDDIACERIINVPARGIGATTLERLRTAASQNFCSVYTAAGSAGKLGTLGKAAVGKVKGFVELITKLKTKCDGPIKDLVEAVITQTGMETDLKAHGSEDGSELENVRELINSAADFDRETPGGTLTEYLQQTALVSDTDRFEGGSGAVTLMTLHAAKGLEFPVVFIVGCEHGLMPFQRAVEENGQEEERRLCFVGITRAQQSLTISHAKYRGIMGARQLRIPSPFLREIAGEDIKIDDLTASNDNASEQFDDDDRWQDHVSQPDPFDDDGFFDADLQQSTTGSSGGIRRGCRVRHKMFGLGRVDKISKSGPHTRVVVDFHQVGRKTLILQYAKLEILN